MNIFYGSNGLGKIIRINAILSVNIKAIAGLITLYN